MYHNGCCGSITKLIRSLIEVDEVVPAFDSSGAGVSLSGYLISRPAGVPLVSVDHSVSGSGNERLGWLF